MERALLPDTLPADFDAVIYGRHPDLDGMDPIELYEHWLAVGMAASRVSTPSTTIQAAIQSAVLEPLTAPTDAIVHFWCTPPAAELAAAVQRAPPGGRVFVVCTGDGRGGVHETRASCLRSGLTVERCYAATIAGGEFCIVLRAPGLRQIYLSIVAHHPAALSAVRLLHNITVLLPHSRVVVVASDTGARANESLRECLRARFPDDDVTTIFVPNDPTTLDVGKQRAALRALDVARYARVVLANDSVICLRNLRDYFRMLARPGLHFGVVDSEQVAYHLPSFLHAFSQEGLTRFTNLLDTAIAAGTITCALDLIQQIEVGFPAQRYESHALFPTAAVCHGGIKNVHFNDAAYAELLESGYPVVKARKLRHTKPYAGPRSAPIPDDFDAATYRAMNSDLSRHGDAAVHAHYRDFGRWEGRRYSEAQDAEVPEYLRRALARAGLTRAGGLEPLASAPRGRSRTLVSYAYCESRASHYNLEFFLREALRGEGDTTFVLVVNGHECSVPLPDNGNLHIIRRPNAGHDFGAHQRAIQFADTLDPFDRTIFLNCGAIGPFIPSYATGLRWTDMFCTPLSDTVGTVGTSIVTLGARDLCDACGGAVGQCSHHTTRSDIPHGVYVEGFAFAVDADVLRACRRANVFAQHATKHEVVRRGEYGVSTATRAAGKAVACLLYRYGACDLTGVGAQPLNGNLHHSRHGCNNGISIHPFEVLFHKWNWRTCTMRPRNVNYADVALYVRWRVDHP